VRNKITYLVPMIVLLLAGLMLAFSSLPPNERTGAPGEQTCGTAGCHGNVDVGSGMVELVVPAEYTAGDTVDIAIDVSNVNQMRWGFEMTVLDASDSPVGELIVAEPVRTQKSTAGNGREYIKHTSTGTDNGTPDSSPGWTVKWASPLSGAGSVTFYAAGNAANGNFSNSGDSIYTTSAVMTELTVECCDLPGDANDDGVVNVGDAVHVINYVFKGGAAPPCLNEADANGDCVVNVGDAVFAINYVFKAGSAPVCGCVI